MVKKNIIGIVMIILIIAAFWGGYKMGNRSAGPTGDSSIKTESSPGMPIPPSTEGAPTKSGSGKGKQQAASTSGDQPTSSKDSVAAVKEEQAAVMQTFYGTVKPFDEAKVQSEQGGTITLLKYKEGDTVKKGEILVRFDNSARLLELEKAKSSKNSSQTQVEQATSNYNNVQMNYERNRNLFEDGLVSQQSLDDLTHKLQIALTSLQSSRENVSQADTQIRIINNSLKDYRVTAPIAGIVDSKSYNLKEVYRSGDVIYHLINIDQVYAEIEVPENYLQKINEGMTVSALFAALDNRAFTGVIETILPSGAVDNRNFKAKVLIKNPDHSIKPGMFARVDVPEESD